MWGRGSYKIDAETRLEIQALNKRWPITDDTRQQIVQKLCGIVGDPVAAHRDVIAASKALMAADAINAKLEQMENDDARRARLIEFAKSFPVGDLVRLAAARGVAIDATAIPSKGRREES